jgi:fatty-acyl-CoA synthase
MRNFAEVLKGYYEHEPESRILTLQHPGEPDFHITYGELLERSNDYAAAYARSGVRPGDMVILILQHGKDIVYSYWGAVLLGAVPSILPFLTEKLAPDRYFADLNALFSFCRPAAVVTYPEFEAGCRRILSGSGRPPGVLVAGCIPVRKGPDFSSLPGLKRRDTEIALVQHSSGSTGLQKGIALSHRAVFRHLEAFSRALRLSRRDVIVSWLPLYHDLGLIDNFLMPILNGVHVVQMSPFDWVREPWRMLTAISDYRATLTFVPNFAYNFCVNKIRDRQIEGVDLSSWRASINGGEPVRFQSHRMFHDRFKSRGLRLETLQNAYGMAEVVCFATLTLTETPRPPRVEEVDRESVLSEGLARPAAGGRPSITIMSCGRPLSNAAVRIIDDNGHDLPERRIGEIVLKSDCMLNEYVNRSDLTAQAFLDGGWLRSGDYGYLADGEVYFTGRKKDIIIVGGKNIYPQDLEAIACEVPGVHPGRTVAFGVTDDSQGTEIVVLIAETDATEAGTCERIANGIRDHVTMNSSIAVRRVQVVGPKWILKTSSGKIARAANKEKFLREFGGDQETGST